MDTVQQAAAILQCRMSWPQAEACAQDLAAAGLLADTTCHSCSGTGGTDLGGARCAVCDGSGHRRAET
jgi:DnaJ-class molecular chaperone